MSQSLVLWKHDAGFFSCSSVRLYAIIEFFNKNKKLPISVDGTKSYNWYKSGDKNIDITSNYFEDYNNNIDIKYSYDVDYHYTHQFVNYSQIKYDDIEPFMKKYFSPNDSIKEIIKNMENKYNLDYENICVLFYRGNDKITETMLCDYNEYIVYANHILKHNPNIKFLLQSDETEFLETMTNIFPHNSFYFDNEIRHMRKCNSSVDILMSNENHIFSKNYLAVTIIMSKCKYIICGSGNCSIWIMLYRGNNKNVIQNLNGKWYVTFIDNH